MFNKKGFPWLLLDNPTIWSTWAPQEKGKSQRKNIIFPAAEKPCLQECCLGRAPFAVQHSS